jgi:hypothetical protein
MKTMCDCVRASGATCKSSTHGDHDLVVRDVFLDDAFGCLAAKNQLSLIIISH